MSWLPRKSVVVPVDFSEPSIAAVDTALDLVEGAEHLHLIHALPVLSPAEPGMVWETISDEGRCEHAQEALREKFKADKYVGIKVAAVVGDAGHAIVDHAQRLSADLIVMPSHGRTGVKRILLGSVAERAVRLAHCPVLVLRS